MNTLSKNLFRGALLTLGLVSASLAHPASEPHAHNTEWLSSTVPAIAIVAGALLAFSLLRKKQS